MSICNKCGKTVSMTYGGFCFMCAMEEKGWPKRDQPDEYYFWLTWEEAQMIIDMFDDHDSNISEKLSNQFLQYAEPQSSLGNVIEK